MTQLWFVAIMILANLVTNLKFIGNVVSFKFCYHEIMEQIVVKFWNLCPNSLTVKLCLVSEYELVENEWNEMELS